MVDLSSMDIKNLTIQQLQEIINIRAEDLNVYIGSQNKVCLTGEVLNASLNGLTVQINLEQAEYDNVMQDEMFQEAFAKQLTKEDIDTIILALKQKADWHTKNYTGKVDDALIMYLNGLILKLEDGYEEQSNA